MTEASLAGNGPAELADLADLGWGPFFQARFDGLDDTVKAGAAPYRVVIEYQDRFRVLGEDGHLVAFLTGNLLRQATEDRLERPAVGDWVAVRRDGEAATIVHVFERRTRFIRQAAGRKVGPQVVAANIDVVFVVTSCNQDFSPRRLERYLTTVENSGARAVVVLNKADLCADPGPFLSELAAVAPSVPALLTSAVTARGLDDMRAQVHPGETAALVGSSGVGKSRLINRLLGEDIQAVGEIREYDGRGRHTTTHRELILMPGGGVLIDTPGMRELKLWQPGDALLAAFPDIATLASACRFRDCRHGDEPGCAVALAVEEGSLALDRMDSYRKLAREQEVQAARGPSSDAPATRPERSTRSSRGAHKKPKRRR